MKTIYQFFADPGHGWLKVTHDEIKQLGIATDITKHSYMRGGHAYLEEDCDAPTFVKAKKKKHLVTPEYRVNSSEKGSRIRGYDSYQPRGYISVILPHRL